MHLELKRPGVTLELLHIEYKKAHPDGFQYTAFCQRYRRWLKLLAPSMRQKHVAGEKTFVDSSGVRPHYIDEATGERHARRAPGPQSRLWCSGGLCGAHQASTRDGHHLRGARPIAGRAR